MTKIEILNLLNKEKTFLKEKFKVKKIGLFGSYAKEIENQIISIKRKKLPKQITLIYI